MGGNIKNVHALTRIDDLLLWIIPVLDKFPRIGLGSRPCRRPGIFL